MAMGIQQVVFLLVMQYVVVQLFLDETIPANIAIGNFFT
jgi:hypothetical protein